MFTNLSVIKQTVYKTCATLPLNLLTRTVFIITIPMTFMGCVTTSSIPPLTPQQCHQLDWQALGFEDGASGHSGAYFGHYIEGSGRVGKPFATCNAATDIVPNRPLWEQGRQQGLLEFCTELNAYKAGIGGQNWPPVCPTNHPDINMSAIEKAYAEGRAVYIERQRLYRMTTPYYSPFYSPFYRRPYGPYSPFIWDDPYDGLGW